MNAPMTVQEVSDFLKIHPATTRKLIAAGELPAVAINRTAKRPTYRVTTEAVSTFLGLDASCTAGRRTSRSGQKR